MQNGIENTKISNLEAIEALGQLLVYYKSDLEYIANFKSFINNKKNINDYLTCNNGFQDFINEFRVARNIKKQKVRDLLLFIKNSKLIQDHRAVDRFAEEMQKKKLTHEGKLLAVLASKIFFLNQPHKIIPMDKFNKKSLGIKGNKYKDFKIKADEFVNTNHKTLSVHLKNIEHYLAKIEKSVDIKMDFKKYRINRFTDKYLWTIGRKQ